MRLKSELYRKEQFILANKIIDILQLDENHQTILYHLDNDKEKQDRIINLIPELRKYFSFSNMKGIESPEILKRPYLSIIRQITKLTHNMSGKDKQITIDGKAIRTRLLTFIKK